MKVIDYIAEKRIKVRRWMFIGLLMSLGATLLTYYTIGMLNKTSETDIYYERNEIQRQLMESLGMDSWLISRMAIFAIVSIFILKFPIRLYERSQLFRYCTNISTSIFVFGMVADLLNNIYML